jgi:glycosyltransferase involved in cell wall biosynthesis
MGNLDKAGFPWREFVTIVEQFANNHPHVNMSVQICGHVSKSAIAHITQTRMRDFFVFHGTLPHQDAFRIVQKSDLLLLLMYETEYSRAIVPQKLYHYLAMGKPILALAGEDGELADIIRQTKTGFVVSPRDLKRPYEILDSNYLSWANGSFQYHPDKHEISKYEYRSLAHKLADTIQGVINS